MMRDIFLTLLSILGADHFNVAIDIAGKSFFEHALLSLVHTFVFSFHS